MQQIQASAFAFAAILQDGSVVTWGRADSGGNSTSVQDQLKGVQQIQASAFAFAAILQDGSIVTWGDAGCGGDSSAVQHALRFVWSLGVVIEWGMRLVLIGILPLTIAHKHLSLQV